MKFPLKKLYLPLGSLLVISLILAILPKLSGTEKTRKEIIKDVIRETILTPSFIPQEKPVTYEYISVTDSCDSSYSGTCVNVRSGPGTEYPVITKLRNGIVLKVESKVKKGNQEWYKITYKGEWLRYPNRVTTDLYVSSDYVTSFFDEGTKEAISTSTKKHIIVDRSEQMLYAYDGKELFMKEKVSTGIELTPTPRGNFTVYKKSPSRYMQGPIPEISDHYYDLPGVPWNLYFTNEGAVIHGAYWHNNFGKVWSNGCVNLPIASAEKLYHWADVGTKVLVRD